MNEIHGKDEDFKAIFKARNPVVLVKFLFENLNFRKRTMFEKKKPRVQNKDSWSSADYS